MSSNRANWVDGWKAVPVHADRMPCELSVVLPFESNEWELYNVAEDFSESTDLAEENPEKLAELVAIFDEEAWKYNVYPLYDDMIQWLAAQQDRLFGDQTEFVYYAPGAVRIAEKSSAPVKNRSHTIETTIDLTGSEERAIAAVGGMTGGFTMFIKDQRLHYDYNYLDGVHYVVSSSPLPRGSTESSSTRLKCRGCTSAPIPSPKLLTWGATRERRSRIYTPVCSSSTAPSTGSWSTFRTR